MEQLMIPPGFDWGTTKNVVFSITALDNIGHLISKAKLEVYSQDPDKGGRLITSGVTGANGKYTVNYQVPAYYDSLYVRTNCVGLVKGRAVDLGPNGFEVVYGGIPASVQTKELMIPSATNTLYTFMGAYNSQGVPAYLELQNDPITASFLDVVNNTLPERVRLDI